MTKVAVVTGSNKGIGFATVEGLCKKFDGHVYLTARNEERGLRAVEELKKKGLSAHFHLLDTTDRASVTALRDHLKEKYGGLDVLVNNAGILFQDTDQPLIVQARATLDTNYFATKQTCDILFPLLRSGARVVNVSSAIGFLPYMGDNQVVAGLKKAFFNVGPPEGGKEPQDSKETAELKKQLATSDSTLAVEELDGLMNGFLKSVEDGTFEKKGWQFFARPEYAVSKVGLSALSRIQSRELQKGAALKDVVLNHTHPGFVATDLNGMSGPMTPEQGAKSSIHAALLEPGTPIKGKLIWKDCEEVDWVNGPPPSMM